MRLGSVLGRRTGNEPSPYEPRVKTPPAGARNDNVVALAAARAGRRGAGRRARPEPLARYAARRHAAA